MVVTLSGNETLLILRQLSNAPSPMVVSGASKRITFTPYSIYSISVISALKASSSRAIRSRPSIVVNHISLSAGTPSEAIVVSGVGAGASGSLQATMPIASIANKAFSSFIIANLSKKNYSFALPKRVADEQSVISTSI